MSLDEKTYRLYRRLGEKVKRADLLMEFDSWVGDDAEVDQVFYLRMYSTKYLEIISPQISEYVRLLKRKEELIRILKYIN